MAAEPVGADTDPGVDPDAAVYRAGLADGKVLLQRCGSCGHFRFPPLPTCPYCGSRTVSIVAATGTGRVYSWVTVRHALAPAAAGEIPYAVAVVELAEGCRVLGRLHDIDGVVCEQPVRVVVVSGADEPYLEFVRVDG